MYESIRLDKYEMDDSTLEAEGPLDEWDDVNEHTHSRTSSLQVDSGGSSPRADVGSPMHLD